MREDLHALAGEYQRDAEIYRERATRPGFDIDYWVGVVDLCEWKARTLLEGPRWAEENEEAA